MKQPQGSLGNKLALGVLLAAAMAVVFLLPGLVKKPWYQPPTDDATVTRAPVGTTDAPFAEAQKTKLRRDAQDLLAELLDSKAKLESKGVSHWAEAEFGNALADAEAGDKDYQLGNYQQAGEKYRQAVENMRSLVARIEPTLRNALQRGRQALAEGDAPAAQENFNAALAIDSQHAEALSGLQRAARLPEVNELLNSATALLENGDPTGAEKLLVRAATIDVLDQRVAATLSKSRAMISNNRFQMAMSRGYQALTRQDFIAAETAFKQAAAINPGNGEVARARQQLAVLRTQLEVDRLLAVAERREATEQWREALATYDKLLALDPTLTTASVRKIPAQVRADLDDKLQQYIDNPLELSATAVHDKASALLSEARKIHEGGPRLRSQIDKLNRALLLAKTEINVKLVSDALTEVTLLRVKKLGQFETASLSLRPGIYTLIGSRTGYRDVRVELKITGEPLAGPVMIRCTEPI